MPVLNCLIVEDEPLAADIIRDYISLVPGLKLIGVCGNVMDATELLRNSDISIIFLDINLPKINGIDFIKTLRDKYEIILTTAYHEYAIDGYGLNVTDYLLKPIEFSRFLQAVNKVFEKQKISSPAIQALTTEKNYYFFNVDKKQVKVFPDDICYIESLKDYVRIHITTGNIVTKFQIGEIEKVLGNADFIRVHKSFIININRITAFDSISVEVNDFSIPIGRSYKEVITKRLQGLK